MNWTLNRIELYLRSSVVFKRCAAIMKLKVVAALALVGLCSARANEVVDEEAEAIVISG